MALPNGRGCTSFKRIFFMTNDIFSHEPKCIAKDRGGGLFSRDEYYVLWLKCFPITLNIIGEYKLILVKKYL